MKSSLSLSEKDAVLVSSVENLLSLISLSRWHVRRKMSLDNCPSLSVIATPSISVHSVSVARWWCYGGCRVASMRRGLGCRVLAPDISNWLQPVSTSSNQLQPVPANSSLFQLVPASSSRFQPAPTAPGQDPAEPRSHVGWPLGAVSIIAEEKFQFFCLCFSPSSSILIGSNTNYFSPSIFFFLFFIFCPWW